MHNGWKHIVFWAAAVWLAAGCAKVMPLTGGDQDKIPPAYRSSDPDTFALNFRGKIITIRFNEFINLKDPTREILISPPVYPDPEYSLNGQAVKIKFKDSLQPDITYVIQFGKAIEDITEANVSTGFSFVFSTGAFLDSGQVNGNITDAFTGKPAAGFKVMLYKPGVTDSFPYKEKPFYLAYTDDQGFFRFRNLRQGDYRIFALKEDNNNYLYDRPGEDIAFRTLPVSTSDSLGVALSAFREATEKIEFNKARSVSPVRTDFYFSGNADSVRVTPYFGFSDSSLFVYEFSKEKDTLTLWHSAMAVDSFGVFLNAPGFSDTALVRTNKTAASGGGAAKRNKPLGNEAVKFSASGNQKFDLYTAPVLTFSEPLEHLDTAKVHLLADSVAVPFRLERDTASPRDYRVLLTPSDKKKYTFSFDSAAFVGISGKVFPGSSYSFAFREVIEYGSIKIVYTDSVIKYPKIWELLKDDKVIRVKFGSANQNEMGFDRLEPGSYRLRLIVDRNENRRWDTGTYTAGEQPEKVIYMTEPIDLKPGWDSEVTWKMVSGLRKKLKDEK